MKAIVVQEDRKNPVLVWETVPDVSFGPDEVLVDVWATAVNRADLLQARGGYAPPAGTTDILGLEMAGVIAAVGEDVEEWQVGDRVCALLPGGGYAEQVAVPAGMLLKLPRRWSFAMGTAVPEVWYTAYVNLFLEGDLVSGETVLIHAGASGVGTAAIQLANAAGATAYVTVGSDEKLLACRKLGAELAINYKQEDFLEKVLAATQDQGVDLILDPVGGGYLDRNVRALKRYGRLVNIGLLGGTHGEMNMGQLLSKRLRLIGSTLRSRPPAEKVKITQQFQAGYWPLLRSGELKPIINTVFPIQQAQEAHAYVAQNKNIGKVILAVRAGADVRPEIPPER
ncbi:MAG: NAD(P)H-quinone oxidoreductase [Ardenticatenaceae bacterium]|nr:NAD(P)H-quinone oxidoreductase [Anaerolineales bacterium]MCB8937478.1 NAD(P)H-quinone oxidoreductase [Ardenticatenaceae bacterium]MCB8975541.1 NAD(P)H-quinone oxidoreductase [Ardenticatenaceae bacterium]